jgi:hypothetical protein
MLFTSDKEPHSPPLLAMLATKSGNLLTIIYAVSERKALLTEAQPIKDIGLVVGDEPGWRSIPISINQ